MMGIKKKHAQVILYSSLVIVVVIITTLIGQSLYIQWKKDSLALRYRESIYKITAEIFNDKVSLSNVNIRYPAGSAGRGVPVAEGSIKNNSDKTITSLLVELSFVRDDGSVAYKIWFHPVGEDIYGETGVPSGINMAKEVIRPGEGISFRQPLRNCPKEVLESIGGRSSPARTTGDRFNVVYGIKGMRVI